MATPTRLWRPRAGIAAVAYAVPSVAEQPAHTDQSNELERNFYEPPAERRLCAPEENGITLASRALRAGLSDGGFCCNDVDVVICQSTFAVHPSPGDAAGVIAEVGLENATFVNIDNGCCSWISGVSLGAALIDAGAAGTVAVLTTTHFVSRATHFAATPPAQVLGDGSAATILTAERDNIAVVGERGRADSWAELRFSPQKSVTGVRLGGDHVNDYEVRFNEEMLKLITLEVPDDSVQAAREAVVAGGYAEADIKTLITHQPNRSMMRRWRRLLNLPHARHVDTFDRFGNVFAANLPITLACAKNDVLIEYPALFLTFTHAGELVSTLILGKEV